MADGVAPALIEETMLDFGFPMGPAALFDLTGIDIAYHVAQTYHRELGDKYSVHPLHKAIYDTGDFGRKTGKGFMDYSGAHPVPNKRILSVIQQYLQQSGVASRSAKKDEIVQTMMGLAINEAALMIEQGICDRPADMDLAMVHGTGFPPYRGGVLRYADVWGLKKVRTALDQLADRYGPRFEPAELIISMAKTGQTFYSS